MSRKDELFLLSIFMATADPETIPEELVEKEAYSVWAIPPDEVVTRLKKLMEGLRAEFGGPQFEPHATVVKAISLTPEDALNKFRSACEGLKAFNATIDRLATGTCLYLLIHPTTELAEACSHCSGHFGYKRSTHLTENEMKKAEERANILDDSLSGLSFPITRLALYKTDPEDKTLKSWEKIAECSLQPK
ncbi:cyclic phosphodiesterase-like isoform X2 [Humulus lupulus]|uniref:cyclic phosphodiesterase-like isoform X2 n=1 Tax=Humulus lupulus TaxID=3486 RepID=UPI002B40F6C0|nr:cyclic phosphodiesterase-like isoform X2 [Humulus lupulus]